MLLPTDTGALKETFPIAVNTCNLAVVNHHISL